jgi:membrane peptidoglycan carboxypeptidase
VRIDYPRAGRQGVRRFVPSWRLLLGLSGIGVVFVVGLFALGYALVKVPSPSSISLAQSASVFYSDGTTPLGHVGARNRESVQLSQVPISVQNAVLAAEDRNFYSEQAVSPTGILRAVLVDLKDRDFVEGGSTITQQYVKNAYLTQQRTLTRKFKEFFIAIKIGRTHKKPEILQDYLNTIYFGRGAYGIQAASQAFFGKDVSKLTTEEGAVLASSIQAPSYLDPALHLSAAEFRWNYVLDGMVKKGWLTPAARAAAKYPTDIESAAATSDLTGSNGYLLATVETELESHGISENQINRGGLKIVTTFDQPTQQAALAAVDKVVGNGRVPADVKTALIAVQPGTGKVLAMYGGSDYLTQPFNEATQSIPPMGSTFKAYVLAAALKSGIPLTKTFSGKSPQTIDGQVYHNDSNESFGQVNLVAATAQSVNTVFVNLGETVGVDKVAAAAYAAGLPSSVALSKNGSMMLGSDSAHPIDAAAAYATFAAGGKYVQPYVVQSVTDSSKCLLDRRGVRRHLRSPGRDHAGDRKVGRHRPAGRRQDRNHVGQCVGLVRRIHAADLDGSRDVPRRERAAPEHCRLQPDLWRHAAGVDVVGVHEGGARAHQGRAVPCGSARTNPVGQALQLGPAVALGDIAAGVDPAGLNAGTRRQLTGCLSAHLVRRAVVRHSLGDAYSDIAAGDTACVPAGLSRGVRGSARPTECDPCARLNEVAAPRPDADQLGFQP